jgi:hypothetical protein
MTSMYGRRAQREDRMSAGQACRALVCVRFVSAELAQCCHGYVDDDCGGQNHRGK